MIEFTIDPRLIPTVNIGTLGHVDHGKSTLVQAITGKWPAVHSEELKRGITIKLGYADATVYRCPEGHLLTESKCLTHGKTCEPVRTVSFVDAPGHETLMATVLAGASLMDGVLLIIAANEKCPQPQTKEHLAVLEIVGIKNIVIAQTKVDLTTPEAAKENYKQIKELVKGTVAESAPIIPVSSQRRVNIDILLETLEIVVPTPKRDPGKAPRMLVVRSFDINKPGTSIEKLKGGILGGGLVSGTFHVGDEIEIRPGMQKGASWQPLKTKITGVQKASQNLDEAGPGGLLGVMTSLDPALSKADALAGSVAGKDLPPTRTSLNLELRPLERILEGVTEPPKQGEVLMINIGTARTVGTIKSIKKKVAEIDLRLPACAASGDRAVLSRRVAERWRLVGTGTVI